MRSGSCARSSPRRGERGKPPHRGGDRDEGNGGIAVIRAGRLIDGTGAEPRRDVTLTVEGGTIVRVEPGGGRPHDATVLDLGEHTGLPGLIYMHAHTVLPGDGTGLERWMELPDEFLLLQASANARAALWSGVTTIRDCGGKGQLMFRVLCGIVIRHRGP